MIVWVTSINVSLYHHPFCLVLLSLQETSEFLILLSEADGAWKKKDVSALELQRWNFLEVLMAQRESRDLSSSVTFFSTFNTIHSFSYLIGFTEPKEAPGAFQIS